MDRLSSLRDRFARIRVVLVEPRYDGNLGQVARAMLNFGLTRLVLAGGRANPASDEARWYSREEGAEVLDAALRVDTVEQAVHGCRMVIGTSRRHGKHRGDGDPPDELFADLAPWDAPWETALVFGREAHGLSTAELELCQRVAWIPTDPACPSLNLAHAVAVTGYALAGAARRAGPEEPVPREFTPATSAEIESLFDHARAAWLRIGYLSQQNPDIILRRWRWIFGRTLLSEGEVRMIRGLLHQVEWLASVAGIPPEGPSAAPDVFNKHRETGSE